MAEATSPIPPSTNGAPQAPPQLDPAETKVFENLVTNLLSSRADFLKWLADPSARSIDRECQHIENPTADDYQAEYDRNPLAARVVEAFPKESWQVQPEVFEAEEGKEPTAFEDAWDGLGAQIRGETSWYRDEDSSPVWEALERADEQSRVGRYGAILVGVDDGSLLDQPAVPKAGRKLLYLRVFSERDCRIAELEADVTSPRFGRPKFYSVSFASPSGYDEGGIQRATVHWTRMVHLADGRTTSEVIGRSAMHACFNNVQDAYKLYGGSAEMFWRGGFAGFAFSTHPQLGGAVKVDADKMREMMQRYADHLDRFLLLKGLTPESLAPEVSDPTPFLKAQVEAICIRIGMPMRIFMGSERGELASSQDDAAWNDRLKARQKYYITPMIIVPFVDRLIWLGVLPEPGEKYSVSWPDLTSQTPGEKATVALQRLQAIAAYINAGAQALLTPYDFWTREMNYSPDEAQAVIDACKKALEDPGTGDQQGSPLLQLVGGINGMIELFKMAKTGGLTEEQLKEQLKLFFGVSDQKADDLLAGGIEVTPPTPPVPPGHNPPALNPAPGQPGTQPGTPAAGTQVQVPTGQGGSSGTGV